VSRPPAAPRLAAPFDLLVFDWDGTLMDSLGSIVACTRATLARLGMPALPDEEIRRSIGLGMLETVERLAPGAGPERVEAVRSCYRDLCQGDFVQREAQRSDYYDLDLRCESGLIGDDIGGGDPLPSGSDAPPDGVAGGSAAPPGAESDPPSSGTDNDGQAPTTEQPDTAQSSSGRSKRASWGCSTAPGAIDPAGASIGLLWLLTVVRRRRMQVA
jgi:hypothetical protein